jgi:hypothetical protein
LNAENGVCCDDIMEAHKNVMSAFLLFDFSQLELVHLDFE